MVAVPKGGRENEMRGYRKFAVAAVCMFAIFLIGCTKKEEKQGGTSEVVMPELAYESDTIATMEAGKDRDIYIGLMNETEDIVHLAENGKSETIISVFPDDKKGNNMITSLYFDGEKNLYIAADIGYGSDAYAEIYKLDVNSKKISKMKTYGQYHHISRMAMLGGELVMLASSRAAEAKEPVLRDAMDIFNYQGEVILSQDGDVVFDEFPILFTVTGEEEVLLYAHADNKGYYYAKAKYDGKKLAVEEPDYQNLGQLSAMTVTGDGTFAYVATSYDKLSLEEFNYKDYTIAELQDSKGVITEPGDLVNADGVIYYRVEGGIKKFIYEQVRKQNRTLQVIESEKIAFENAPYGCGYQMKMERLSDDEMSLKMLSQDSDYDVCFMQSDDPFGYQVKEKGSFYPLTDIGEVSKYLDACFPYFKEAATDRDGEIWMLPVAASADCMLYDEEMLKKYGIEKEKLASFDSFVNTLKALPEEAKKCIFAPSGYAERIYLSKFAGGEGFDNQEFRKAAVLLKEMQEEDVFEYHQEAGDAVNMHKQDDFICGIKMAQTNTNKAFLSNPYVKAGMLPAVTDKDTFRVKCSFICVNAASDNLDAALEYVKSLCSYLMEQENTMMIRDKEKYLDTELAKTLYDLYEKGTITFGVPEELYYDAWDEYKEGSMDLEQMIAEAERRRKIYREEG